MIRPSPTNGAKEAYNMRCGDLLREAWVPRPADAPKLSLRQQVRAWWQACRPPFFITAAIPVTLALALTFRQQGGVAAGQWATYALLLVGCFMGLTIANLANDLFDHILGVDGGSGWLACGPVPAGCALLSCGLRTHPRSGPGRLAVAGCARASGAQMLSDQRRGPDTGRAAVAYASQNGALLMRGRFWS